MSIYEYKVLNAKGEEQSMADYKGKKLLIVNTASKCGFTPQYQGLQALHEKHGDNLQILAFPCNQFGAQEPGTEEEIVQFCDLNFNVTFPIMKKVDVNGDNANPLFQYLKKAMPGLLGSEAVKWNFTKFLIDENGNPVKRFAPKDDPTEVESFL